MSKALKFPRWYVKDRKGHAYVVGKETFEGAEQHWRFCEQKYLGDAPHTIVRVDRNGGPEVDCTPKPGRCS